MDACTRFPVVCVCVWQHHDAHLELLHSRELGEGQQRPHHRQHQDQDVRARLKCGPLPQVLSNVGATVVGFDMWNAY